MVCKETKKDDVLKFRQYYMSEGCNRPVVRSGAQLWGIANDDFTWNVLVEASTPSVIKRMIDFYSDSISKSLAVYAHEDKYEIVPPEQWPDKVCAALAKRALLGADDEEA